MTKKVRIENADTSSHKIIVQTWSKGANGTPDTLQKEQELLHPADIGDFWVRKEQYIVVKEA